MLKPQNKPSKFGFYGIVYKATNKVNGKVYVGLTTERLTERIKRHVKLSKSENCFYFQNAIRKYGIDGFDFEIIAECLTRDELKEKEIFYIAEYQSVNREKGYNLTNGGDGTKSFTPEMRLKLSIANTGKKHTEESKKKMSAAKKGRKHTEEQNRKQSERRKGIKHTEEAKQKISKAHKGIKHTEEQNRKQSERQKGKKLSEEAKRKESISQKKAWEKRGEWHHSEETRKKLSASHKGVKLSDSHRASMSKSARERPTAGSAHPRKMVQQLDLAGNIVNEYVSVNEAARSIGVAQMSISAACTGGQKTAKGFIWRFKNEEDRLQAVENRLSGVGYKPVLQMDKLGNVINEFSSIGEAAIKCGLLPKSVSRVCLGKRKSSGGFIWRFKNEEDQPK